jgi:hypothetical protein
MIKRMMVLFAVSAAVVVPLSSQSAPEFDSMVFGTATLRLGMTPSAVARVLAPTYILQEIGHGQFGSSFMIVTKSGPPYDAPGSVSFDVSGSARSIKRDWSPLDQHAGAETADALYNALTRLMPLPSTSSGESNRACNCFIALEGPSPRNNVSSISILNGNKTVAVSISESPGFARAVTVDETIERIKR